MSKGKEITFYERERIETYLRMKKKKNMKNITKNQPLQEPQLNTELVRLNKFISGTGLCSRREADRLIDQGRVLVNGENPEVGTKVSPTDQVVVDGKALRSKEKSIYIALNKPTGITCTTELKVKDNIINKLKDL